MAKWIIDMLHSDVHFKTRYLLISSVTGEFKKFEGMMESSRHDFTDATIRFSAQTASVTTNNEKRDAHLHEADFFDVEKFPEMEFVSTGFWRTEENEYKLKGNLIIKGVSNPVELKVISGGLARDPEGKERAGFEISGSVNRYDYGLIWSLLTESGALLLAEEVKIHANVQMIKLSE